MHISIAPETIFNIGGIGITNAVFTAVVIVLLLGVYLVFASRKFSTFNPSKVQLFLEMIVGGFSGMIGEIIGVHGRKYFPFAFTFFVFVILSSWFGLLPFTPSFGKVEEVSTHTEALANTEHEDSVISEGHESEDSSCVADRDCVLDVTNLGVGGGEITHLFRAPTSDVNMTLALAVVSVLFTNFLAIKHTGIKGFITKYFHSFAPMDLFVGILEVVSELGKIISFTFRLFGNIFAGEVLLLVITNLTYGLFTLPFLGLEVFVGFIQAFVFIMLTAVFMGIATTQHKEH